jgi:hypothetical protein
MIVGRRQERRIQITTVGSRENLVNISNAEYIVAEYTGANIPFPTHPGVYRSQRIPLKDSRYDDFVLEACLK